MPNLTVSSNVDTLLSAADNAAIRTAIGLGSTNSPSFSSINTTDRVGIGTSAPAVKLDVVGDSRVSAGSFNVDRPGGNFSNVIQFRARGTGDGSYFGSPAGNGAGEIISAGLTGLLIGSVTSAPVILGTNNVERFRILSTGEVGIGTTAPLARLHVAFPTSLTGLNLVSDAATSVSNFVTWSTAWGPLSGGIKSGPDNGWTTQIYSNQQLSFSARGVDSSDLLISATGNVGIGINAPTSKLHVVGDAVLTGQLLGGDYTVGTVATATQANISITNNHTATVNSGIVITPKGTGAFILGPKPDGTITGGGARGAGAVDLQMSRTNAALFAEGNYSAIGGGSSNWATGANSVIGGGINNTVLGLNAAIGGGNSNVARESHSTIGGGITNTCAAGSSYSFIGGGQSNTASGSHSFVGGGQSNTASAQYSVIGGGSSNLAQSYLAGVGGGVSNISNGYASYIGGGTSHSATGAYAFIGGGTVNNATAENSMCLGGNYSLADRHGLFAHANGRFAATGDAQKTTAVFRNKTTTNSAVELFLNGTAARYTITSGKIISMLINITGTKSDGSAVAHYVRQYSIKNIGGTTSQVYAAVTVGTDYNPSGTAIAISADATNNSLKIEVTGVTSETWRWVASVDAVEVGHGV